MILTDLIFLAALINAAVGTVYVRIWAARRAAWEERCDYVTIYRRLRLGVLFFVLPGMSVALFGSRLLQFAGAGLSALSLPWILSAAAVFVFAILWLAGAVRHVFRYVREIRVFSRIFEHNIDIAGDSRLKEYYDEICARHEMAYSVSVFMNPEIETPVVFGVRRRMILLPTDCTDEKELRIILEHELLHIRHNDLLLKQIADVISRILWFIPQPKRMVAQMDEWGETLCDLSLCGCSVSRWSPGEYFGIVAKSALERTKRREMAAVAFSGESSMIRIRVCRMRSYMDRQSRSDEPRTGFLPDRRAVFCALAVALCVVFGLSAAGRLATVHIATDSLAAHTLPWSGLQPNAVKVRGSSTVPALGSRYRLLYLEENEQIRITYASHASGLADVSGTDDGTASFGVFGSVTLTKLSGEEADNKPVALTASAFADVFVEESGWYVLRWDNSRADSAVTVDYVLIRQ